MDYKLEQFYGKKVVIYGSGIIAQRIISAFPKENIVGVLDRSKFTGTICGIPIIMWEDIAEDSVDLLIIAAKLHNYYPIYCRILDRCIALGIKIYNPKGQDLMKCFGVGSMQKNICYNVDKEELKKKIENYDVISFDVFDTLIMRNALEPADIFDLVDAKLKKRNIKINDFKRCRREAELQSKGSNIYGIYDILKENLSLDEETKQQILEVEIECEKRAIIPRREMLDIYKYAVQLHKKIYIVSDMYLPSDIIKSILYQVGVSEFDAIFVSCEYGVGKGNGLFDIVKTHFGNRTCLHIGDNPYADIESAIKAGIDAYEINNAFHLFHASGLHYASAFTKTANDKILLGLVAAELFNNPFTKVENLEKITFSSLEALCKVLVAPFVINWVHKLKHNLEHNEYDGILFAARDGYFFKKLYNLLPESFIKKVPDYYIYCSRKLAIRTGMDSESEVTYAAKYCDLEKSNKKQIENMFGIQITEESQDYVLTEMDSIQNYSQKVCGYYKNYLIDSGIDLSKKYLLCDLNGRGTSHYFLNKLFSKDLNSFYLYKFHEQGKYEMDSDAVYHLMFSDVEDKYNSLIMNHQLIEFLFSAPHASINDIDENGNPVYAEEVRSEKMITLMETMQNYLLSYLKQYFEDYYIEEAEVSGDVAEHIYDIFATANYVNECKVIHEMQLYDDIRGSSQKVL